MQIIISIIALIYGFDLYYNSTEHNGRIVKLIYIELIYNLVIKYAIGNLRLPSFFNYFTDFILLWILAEYIHQKRRYILRIPKTLVICVSIFWIASIVSFVGNLYSPLLYLWGFRNNFRFLLYAMMCSLYLKRDDIKKIMDILFKFFVFNIVVVTYQAFFVNYDMGASGDFISGLFSNGGERGGNGALDWLMCIVCTYFIIQYLNLEENLYRMLIAVLGSVYISAVSEIKIFFLQIVLIGIIALILCKKSFKTVIFILGGAFILIIGIRWLYLLFPEFANFFQLESIITYVTRDSGYGSSIRNGNFGIDRLTAIPYILNNFLTRPAQKVIGIGLGNADYSSSFLFLTSEFYYKYGLIGYQYFYLPFLMIEMGFFGVTSYALILLNYALTALKLPEQEEIFRTIKYFTVIIVGIVFLMIMYNQTMKSETSGYLVHCILSFSFVLLKKESPESCDDLQSMKGEI